MHASGVTRVGVSRQVCAAATKNPSVRPCALPSAPSHRYQQLPPRASAAEGRPLRYIPGLDSTKKLRWNVARATSEGEVQSSSVDELSIPKGTTWELDFCSRPLVDEKGKKVWELLVCNPERTFEYARYFPNNLVNSAEVKRALLALLDLPGAERPSKVRYFRGQMQTIISRALSELDVKVVPSRRCFTIIAWLEERLEAVYRPDPRFQADAQPPYQLDLGAPQDLPDALRGEKWAFVEFPLGALLEEAKAVGAGEAFGATFSLEAAGCADLSPETLVPGVAVFSRRSQPLSAWTNSLELASITADTDRACLVLETGVSTRWRYGSYRRSKETTAESEAWEAAKAATFGLHFLAVQSDPEAEKCDGFWMLQERPPPQI